MNIAGTTGSLIWTRSLRLKLVGSSINCVRVFDSVLMFSNFKLFSVNQQISENSWNILSLMVWYAGHWDKIWEIDSFSNSQILHTGLPCPDPSYFLSYVNHFGLIAIKSVLNVFIVVSSLRHRVIFMFFAWIVYFYFNFSSLKIILGLI